MTWNASGRLALAALTAVLAVAQAVAGTFHVAPVRVDITPDARSGVLTIRNDAADEPVVIHARTLLWTQREGRDHTEPTTELLVNPPVFTIKPGGQQIVRVGLRNPAQATEAANELSYRLLLAEVPGAAPSDFRGIRVALNMTIPIFVAPRAAASASGSERPLLTVSRGSDGKLTASAQNRDNRRFHITEMALLDSQADKTLAASNEARYVLPGSVVPWRIADAPPAPARYTLRLRSDRGVFSYAVSEADGSAVVEALPATSSMNKSP